MPDWLTHVLFAYIVCKVLGLRFKSVDRASIAIVLIGALLPDITKVKLVFGLVGIEVQDMVEPLHTPAGSLLVAALISLFFFDPRRIFLLLAFGAGTHYLLDLMESSTGGGMRLLFPLSWGQYSLGLMPNDDWRDGVILLVVVLSGSIAVWLFQRISGRESGKF